MISSMIINIENHGADLLVWVELRGFEPLTPSMRTRCATGLRYSPIRGRPGRPGRLHGSRRTRSIRRSESRRSSGERSGGHRS